MCVGIALEREEEEANDSFDREFLLGQERERANASEGVDLID